MLRPLILVSLLVSSIVAEEEERKPEPGPVPTTILRLEELSIPAGKGDAQGALTAFLEAHEAHRKGDLDRALKGYLAFLGIDARVALPARYEKTVKERLDGILARIRTRYERALVLYEKNRRKGLAALREIAERYPMLPEGKAALALDQTDAIHFAMADARALAEKGEKKKAAESLEKAVLRSPAALYLYEAKSLLVELGGPDLFDADERLGGEDEEDEGDGKREDEDEETVIEMDD